MYASGQARLLVWMHKDSSFLQAVGMHVSGQIKVLQSFITTLLLLLQDPMTQQQMLGMMPMGMLPDQLQGYGMLPGHFSGQQGSESYMQDGQDEEEDGSKAEANAEGALQRFGGLLHPFLGVLCLLCHADSRVSWYLVMAASCPLCGPVQQPAGL
jgi:hypothetical protein